MIKMLVLNQTLKHLLHETIGHEPKKMRVLLEINSPEGNQPAAGQVGEYDLFGEGACNGTVFTTLSLWHGAGDFMFSPTEASLHSSDVFLPERREALEAAVRKNAARNRPIEKTKPSRPNTPNPGERQG